ncbi:MAG: sigma-70 family RNA polymerase sigma factor [Pseudomonadota bacterium]
MGESATRQDDAARMAAIAAGDQAALVALMTAQGPGLRAVATRYLGSAVEAEDVVQETFVKAWQRADRYDPSRAAVSTWLYRIAVNACIDRQRRRSLSRMMGLEEAGVEERDGSTGGMAADQPSTERRTAARQRLDAARTAIAALPGRQRMAILLAAVAGLGTAEIAEALGTSRGSVEQLLVRARRRLRRELGDDEGLA